jgi:hypothetical protein
MSEVRSSGFLPFLRMRATAVSSQEDSMARIISFLYVAGAIF